MRNIAVLSFMILLVQQARGATYIHGRNINQGGVKLKIHKVEFGDFEALKLTNRNNVVMEFDCKKNEFNTKKKNYLNYRNFYNMEVGDFVLDSKSCNYLKTFLILTFEAISDEYPVEIELDIPSRKVSKVILPPLDPYWDGYGQEKKAAKTLAFKRHPKVNCMHGRNPKF